MANAATRELTVCRLLSLESMCAVAPFGRNRTNGSPNGTGDAACEAWPNMRRLLQIAALLAISTAVVFMHSSARPASNEQIATPPHFTPAPDQTPLTPAQVHDLVARAIVNQHRDDAALDCFERIERHIERNAGSENRVTEDKTYRVVPTGSGNIKILVKNFDTPVPAGDYQRDLNTWQSILSVAVHPNDPRQVASLAKQEKKLKDRARLVDAAFDAYNMSWVGRETLNGRTIEKLHFEPNPAYVSRGSTADWLVHARATVWIDAQAAEVVRIEAEIIRDISIGAGILGKVYKGGQFILEQAEAAPGIWEPTLYEYDLSGRKFLFPFKMREVTRAGRYRYLGSPDKALAVARKDLSAGGGFISDP